MPPKVMASNPISEVLNTTELLTLVLSHLDPHSLLLNAPLVSRAWHHIISNTPLLQEALFFRPSPSPHLTLNPLLGAAFPGYFPVYTECHPDLWNEPWLRNPEAFRRKEASWRKMLIWKGGALERMRKIKVISTIGTMEGYFAQTAYLEREEGVRMGVLWDLPHTPYSTEEEYCGFYLNWNTDLLPRRYYDEDEPVLEDSVIDRMRWMFRGAGVPVERREVESGNRVEGEEGHLFEIGFSVSGYMLCFGRDICAQPTRVVGEGFCSEAYEKVELEWGEVVEVLDFYGSEDERFHETSD
jgi:hypothetical protein